MRDARITTIYEGTTGIQSNDLIGRKIGRDGVHCNEPVIADMSSELRELDASAPAAGATRRQRWRLLPAERLDRIPGKALASRPEPQWPCQFLSDAVRIRHRWLAHCESRPPLRPGIFTGPDQSFYDSKLHTGAFTHSRYCRSPGTRTNCPGRSRKRGDTDAALI